MQHYLKIGTDRFGPDFKLLSATDGVESDRSKLSKETFEGRLHVWLQHN